MFQIWGTVFELQTRALWLYYTQSIKTLHKDHT